MAHALALSPNLMGAIPTEKLLHPQPVGFPSTLNSPLAWTPRGVLSKRKETILELTPSDLKEIKLAAENFKKSDLPIYKLSPANFPLSNLAQRIHTVKATLYTGFGFVTLRGLKPQDYTPDEHVIIHAGLASYFGNQRAVQQKWGQKSAEALLHVSDIKKNTKEGVFLAPGNLSIGMTFHSDAGDILSLYCRQMPVEGGQLYLASGWAIYNELVVSRPDVLQVLSQPWVWQESRTGDAELRSKLQPLLYFQDGKLIFNFQRRPFMGPAHEPRDPRLPALTPAQSEALDVIDQVAVNLAIDVDQQPGDINFINNLALLHARGGFTDGKEPWQRRHSTRLIVRDAERAWSIPIPLHDDWKKYYDHDPAVEIFQTEPHPWDFTMAGHD